MNIPFSSQFDNSISAEWQTEICGIASLKMLMDFWMSQGNFQNGFGEAESIPSIKDILEKGLEMNAYTFNTGWFHKGLVRVSEEFGFSGYNRDLAHLDFGEAYEIFLSDLHEHPLMASVYSGFNPENKGGHLVVAVEYFIESEGGNGENIVFLDPKEKSLKKAKKIFSREEFQKFWKKRYIVIYPKNKYV